MLGCRHELAHAKGGLINEDREGGIHYYYSYYYTYYHYYTYYYYYYYYKGGLINEDREGGIQGLWFRASGSGFRV